MNYKEYIFIAVLFLSSFFMWSIPFHESQMPFGEGDASYHFSMGDYQYTTGKTMGIVGLPPYLGYRYYGANTKLGPMALQNPPTLRLGYAIASTAGGGRFIPQNIFVVLTSFLGVFTFYMLFRRLYGFMTAACVSIALMFSARSIMVYIWGQRPNLTAFALVPVAVYFLYEYAVSFYSEEHGTEPKNSYIYLFAAAFSAAFLMHLQAALILVPIAIAFSILMFIKHKKFIVNSKNIRHFLTAAVVIFVICFPFLGFYSGTEEAQSVEYGINNIGDIFKWFVRKDDNFGLNPSFLDYSNTYMSKLTIVFLLAGVAIMFKRFSNADITVLSCLAGLYGIFHLHLIGEGILSYRIARYLILEEPFFYAAIVIGILSIPSFIRLGKDSRANARVLLALAFALLVIFTQGAQAHGLLKTAYPGIMRVSGDEYLATQWIMENTGLEDTFYMLGPLQYQKSYFVRAFSQRFMQVWGGPINESFVGLNEKRNEFGFKPVYPKYIMLDYSDINAIGANHPLSVQKSTEMNELIGFMANDIEIVYDKKGVKIYRINEGFFEK